MTTRKYTCKKCSFSSPIYAKENKSQWFSVSTLAIEGQKATLFPHGNATQTTVVETAHSSQAPSTSADVTYTHSLRAPVTSIISQETMNSTRTINTSEIVTSSALSSTTAPADVPSQNVRVNEERPAVSSDSQPPIPPPPRVNPDTDVCPDHVQRICRRCRTCPLLHPTLCPGFLKDGHGPEGCPSPDVCGSQIADSDILIYVNRAGTIECVT